MRAAILATALAGLVSSPAFAADASTPISATATSAAALSPSARIGAPTRHASKLDGHGNGLWIIGAAAAVGGVIYAFAQDDDDNERPVSP
ncbi:MAG TPA: hypothetical protein VNZ43_05260 [Sphingomonadaceae bacterium]|jgi:hypothetical protein|nr:hypothetical protein [Sphingomonadaceae bacterium]